MSIDKLLRQEAKALGLSRQIIRRAMRDAALARYGVQWDMVETAKGVSVRRGTPSYVPKDIHSRQERRKLARAIAAGEWKRHKAA